MDYSEIVKDYSCQSVFHSFSFDFNSAQIPAPAL